MRKQDSGTKDIECSSKNLTIVELNILGDLHLKRRWSRGDSHREGIEQLQLNIQIIQLVILYNIGFVIVRFIILYARFRVQSNTGTYHLFCEGNGNTRV
jgi:hypothetical protein